jgi:hypothetical protein
MQKDMHYYATYALAKAAGIPEADAATIAYASQFTDDSPYYDSLIHDDKGMLHATPTSSHPDVSLLDDDLASRKRIADEKREIWIPFHFYPGGMGRTFEERIQCVSGGDLVGEALRNHVTVCARKPYLLELIGVCAHAYLDTFSHFGFSGMVSQLNNIAEVTVSVDDLSPEDAQLYARKAEVRNAPQDAPGHLAVSNLTDLPYLTWGFSYAVARPDGTTVSRRDNVASYLEGCAGLHGFLVGFAEMRYGERRRRAVAFGEIRNRIRNLLEQRRGMDERCGLWAASDLAGGVPPYDPMAWERDKRNFHRLPASADGIATPIYRYHQATAYHKFHTLKELLPSHGMAVY